MGAGLKSKENNLFEWEAAGSMIDEHMHCQINLGLIKKQTYYTGLVYLLLYSGGFRLLILSMTSNIQAS